MSPPRGPCPDFQLSLLISANSVVNIDTDKSLQNSKKQFATRTKRSRTLDPGSCLGYTFIQNTFIAFDRLGQIVLLRLLIRLLYSQIIMKR